jgi:hypothetical protein
MAAENTDFGTAIEIPDANGTIVRSRDEDWIGGIGKGCVVLKAHDTVGMALTEHISE